MLGMQTDSHKTYRIGRKFYLTLTITRFWKFVDAMANPSDFFGSQDPLEVM